MCAQVWIYPLGHGHLIGTTSPKQVDCSFLSISQLPITSQQWVGLPSTLSLFLIHAKTDLTFCSSHADNQNACEFMGEIAISCHKTRICQYSFSTSTSHFFLSFPLGKNVDIDVPIRTNHLALTYSQHLDQLGVSAFIAAHCKRNFSNQHLKQYLSMVMSINIQKAVYQANHLANNYNKFYSSVHDLPVLGWFTYQEGSHFCETALKPSYQSYVTIAIMKVSCLAGQYCSMHGPVPENDIDGFSLPAAYMAPSNTVKASLQEESLLVSFNLISLCFDQKGLFGEPIGLP